MVRRSIGFFLLLALSVAACGDEAPPPPQAEAGAEVAAASTSAVYRDVREVLHDEGQLEAYRVLRRRLADGFDEICGDTFCGGDYNDIASIQLACSANEATAEVRGCAWSFGGSYGAVDGPSGEVRVGATAFSCQFFVGAGASAFLDTLGASDSPLYEPLPGQGVAIIDSLYDCLQPPGPLPLGEGGPYVDAVEALDGADFERFVGVRRALAARFEELCGDSFCEGEYPDIEPLSLRCSVDPQAGRFGGCTWAFAGASARVAARTGRVIFDRETFACPLPLRGPVDEVLSALEGASDPLNAPLPGGGKATTINNALIDCL